MEKQNKINLGINLLRMWMAFEVILLHRMSWKGYESPFFQFLKACELFSVPVFVIISFYFSAKMIEQNDPAKMKERLIRLAIPQVGWAIICWIVYVLTDIIFMHDLQHNIADLLIAIISGCRQNTNPSTWFQAVLILLTCFYFLVFRLLDKKKAWFFVYLSIGIALFVQFDGSYFRFFETMPYELTNTIGRIFEIMPFAGIGLLLRHIGIYEVLKEKRIAAILISIVLFGLGFYLTFPSVEDFFGGFYPIYMAFFLFVIFLLLPLEKISGQTRKMILTASRFTLGIYCSHRLVYGIMEILYELCGISLRHFSKCLVTYLVCYIGSYIVSLIPNKFIKNMVD